MKKILMLFPLLFQVPSYALDIKGTLRYFFKTEQGRIRVLSACVIGVGIFSNKAAMELVNNKNKGKLIF